MRMPLPTLARLLPLTAAAFLMAADGDACIIVRPDDNGDRDDDDGDDGDDECTDLSRLCPSLACDNGFLADADGCAICECQPTACSSDGAVSPPPPECANAVFDDVTCQWSCLGSECRADADCPSSTVCVDGVCRGLGAGCSSDAECGPGFFCDFGSAAAPSPPDGDAARPAPLGQCVQLPTCFSDADCRPGERCLPADQAGGLVAIASVCVADPNQQCSVDDDCALGERCIFDCTGSCPNCDDCTVIVSSCAAVPVPCDSDAQCRLGETCLFDGASQRPCRDAGCSSGTDPLPAQGVCGVAHVVPSCTVDEECGPGEVCRGADPCICSAICIDDGMGGCLPCDCQPLPGTCALVGPGDDECFDDTRCAAGEKCVIYAVGCESACVTNPDGTTECHPCDPVAVGRCEAAPAFCGSDGDCGAGEFCDLEVVCPAIAVECPEGQVVIDLDGDGCALECVDRARCELLGGCGAPPGLCTRLPSDPCAGVICRGTDVCIVDAAGNAACVENPCLSVRCDAETFCEVQPDGSALCVSNPPMRSCRSDADCAEAEVCTVSRGDCQSNPSCGPEGPCTDECWGACVAR